jgi:glycosyltransferase involved in cell wall biosynthesis
MNLLLFTSTYPYGAGKEQPYLELEVQYLRRVFDRVILVPKKNLGMALPLPNGVDLDESYAALLNRVNWFSLAGRLLRSRLLYRELFHRPSLIFYPQAIKRMLRFCAVAMLTYDWVRAWLGSNDGSTSVFYTWWFDSSTMGIGLAKQKDGVLRLVSRVHGYDLYEEYYYKPPYWPFRRQALSLVDALFPDSDAGLQYLLRRYPDFASLYETALLGVTGAESLSLPSSDGIFRIVSCSTFAPLKRVELILEGVLCAAQLRPRQRFEWTHIGNGDLRTKLQERADNTFPPNARAFFLTYSGNEALAHFYQQSPVDVFINASATEGTSVAVMEATSFGIPVIATSVGGNPEIVKDKNGILLGANPSPEEIARAFHVFLDNPALAARKRRGSYEVWSERYNADVNYRVFAERLKSIREDQ